MYRYFSNPRMPLKSANKIDDYCTCTSFCLVEVNNQCAKGRVIHANITVSNGVIHIVDGLLGYVYNDIYNSLDDDNELR